MTYLLLCYIIGQIAYHHLMAALFLFFIILITMYRKRKNKLLMVISFLIVSIGYGIEKKQHAPLEHIQPSYTQQPNEKKNVLIHFSSLPLIKEGLLTANISDFNKQLVLKAPFKTKINVPNANFFLNHACPVKGIYRDPQHLSQLEVLFVKKIDFNRCISMQPKFKDYIMYARNSLIERIRAHHFIGQGEILAIATGSTDDMSSEIKARARDLGISHLYAISGTHVSILIALFYMFTKRLPIPIYVIESLLLLFLPLFLIFVNASPSAQRAVLMTMLILILSKYFHFTSIQALACVYIFMSFLNIQYHHHLGFIYSFLISSVLILMKDLLNKYQFVYSLILASVISIVAVLPINYLQFNEIQWQGIISNIIFIPLYSFVIIPFSFIVGLCALIYPSLLFLFKPLSMIIFTIQNFILKGLQPLTQYHFPIADFGEVGFLMITIVTFILLYFLSNEKYLLFFLTAVSFLFIATHLHPNYPNQMTILDVGQGDAIFFQNKNGKTLLIDTGGLAEHGSMKKQNYNITEKSTYPLFKKRGIHHVDYLIITHDHNDHLGELAHISKYIKIKNIIINPSHFNQEKLQWIQNIAKSQHTKLLSYKDISFIDLGAFKFTLLDTNIENSADPNEHSIITLASIDQTHILLMGDATEKNELKLLANYRLPKIQILKVGHHGSQTSSSTSFINEMRPQIALISAGRNNVYHLPHPTTIQKLRAIHAKVYNTADNHHINIEFNDKGKTSYQIHTEKAS